jgi:hypothetical protein
MYAVPWNPGLAAPMGLDPGSSSEEFLTASWKYPGADRDHWECGLPDRLAFPYFLGFSAYTLNQIKEKGIWTI